MKKSWIRKFYLLAPIITIGFVALSCKSISAKTKNGEVMAAQALVKRVVPDLDKKVRFEVIPTPKGKDRYELESVNGKIVIRGNSAVAMSAGLYHYLKEFCHCHVSRMGNNLTVPKKLAQIPHKISVTSKVKYRFAYNYCTHGYTMSWWNWQRWEQELDWLALHGVNIALIIEGQSSVWQKTFTQFGYTKEEMRKWICSPAHQPWQFMQNMEGLLPPTQGIMDKRLLLGQKIVQRCRELGIQPVLQGYYGMVPTNFSKRYPTATIVAQGRWGGGSQRRPDMLNPASALFRKIAATFYAEQKKLFGDCYYFAIDPFHEGGRTGPMKRGTVYKQTQDAMLTFEPKAILVKQCWQTSNADMFNAGNKDKSLALDLWCDVAPFWKRCNGYNGTPWVWSMVHNFGGNLGMEGNLPRLCKDLASTFASPQKGNLQGIAFVPEGSHENPVIYELFTEIGWRGVPKNLNAWIENYIHARYGKKNIAASKAWQIMLKSNYNITSGQSPFNSVIASSPKISKNPHARTWTKGSKPLYDNRRLAKAWQQMLTASQQLGKVDSFRFDLADITRQTLCNLSYPIYISMINAYKNKNLPQFKKDAKAFLELITDIDTIVATRQDCLMGKWIADARSWGDTKKEKKYLDLCARMLVTTWVPNPNTRLNDYANREWAGLVKAYYLPRWQLFIRTLRKGLKTGKKANFAAFKKEHNQFQINWIKSEAPLPAYPKGDTIEVSKKLFNKYNKIIKQYSK